MERCPLHIFICMKKVRLSVIRTSLTYMCTRKFYKVYQNIIGFKLFLKGIDIVKSWPGPG